MPETRSSVVPSGPLADSGPEPVAGIPAVAPDPGAAATVLRGTVHVAGSSAPVSGALVAVRLAPAGRGGASAPAEWRDVVLAAGLTGDDGAFVLALDADGLPLGLAAAIRCDEQMALRVEVVQGSRRVPAAPDFRLDDAEADVELTVAVHEPSATRLRTLVRRARAAEADTVGDLAALAADGREPLDAAQLAAAIERAAVDPTGALAEVGAVPAWSTVQDRAAYADYVRSLGDAAARADVARALDLLGTAAGTDMQIRDLPLAVDLHVVEADGIRAGLLGGLLGQRGPVLGTIRRPAPRIGYRDYLVGAWGAWSVLRAKQGYILHTPTADESRHQLEHRFGQGFTTTDLTTGPAHALLIPIVRTILTTAAPPTGIGAGLAPASVPAQGARSDREYTAALVAASGVTAAEFALRYRIVVDRPEGAVSSPVEENIATLLAFFRDGWQSEVDPSRADPDLWSTPIVPEWDLGIAPFFLEYDEWLESTAPWFPEDFLSLRRMLATDHVRVLDSAVAAADKGWVAKVTAVMDAVDKANGWYDTGEFALARDGYDAAWTAALTALQDPAVHAYDPASALARRRRMKVDAKQPLLVFERAFTGGDLNVYISSTERLQLWLRMFAGYAFWVWYADCLSALGDLAGAARFHSVLCEPVIGAGTVDSPAGAFDYWGDAPWLYTAGDLPYTVLRSSIRYGNPFLPDEKFAGAGGGWLPSSYGVAPKQFRTLLHSVDRSFCDLRLGEAMIEWADALFRSDDAASRQRARELYKGVLILFGEDPGISPHWPGQVVPGWTPVIVLGFVQNPAVVSQLQRARLGLYKLSAGLNWFGYTDAFVPTLRYRALKDSADSFCALAAAAQQELLSAITSLEALTVDQMRVSTMVAKAGAQQQIAAQQITIANAGVTQAQSQIDAVQKQIDAKRKEQEDKDSFGSQLGDFFSGVAKTFTGLPFGAGPAIGGAAASEAGISSAGAAGFMGIGAAATVTAGFAVFAYAGYTSMSAMADAYNSLSGQITALEKVAMPAAQLGKQVKQSELDIAKLNSSIADADAQLAHRLMTYNEARLLNADFWNGMAAVLRRSLRRFLELGAWAGWLAERALAFEQSRPVSIMRLDYFPRAMQGVTGSDLLALDLAELEASRIAGARALVPFRHTISLAADFPLAMGELKTVGSARFLTDERMLRAAYPGTFGHRVQTVTVAASGPAATRSLRGSLINDGVSLLSADAGLAPAPLVAAATALPLGDAATTAGAIPGLPADQLRPFEGFGTSTAWRLELSTPPAEPAVASLLDVLVTIEGTAQFTAEPLPEAEPAPSHGALLLAASAFAPAALTALRAGKPASLDFDLRGLPAGAAPRVLANLAVILPGLADDAVAGTVRLLGDGTSAPFTTDRGFAASTADPLRDAAGPLPASSLDPLVGAKLDQAVRIELSPAANAGVDFAALVDVVLEVEYAE